MEQGNRPSPSLLLSKCPWADSEVQFPVPKPPPRAWNVSHRRADKITSLSSGKQVRWCCDNNDAFTVFFTQHKERPVDRGLPIAATDSRSNRNTVKKKKPLSFWKLPQELLRCTEMLTDQFTWERTKEKELFSRTWCAALIFFFLNYLSAARHWNHAVTQALTSATRKCFSLAKKPKAKQQEPILWWHHASWQVCHRWVTPHRGICDKLRWTACRSWLVVFLIKVRSYKDLTGSKRS